MDIIRRRSKVLILFLVFLFSTQNYFILSLGSMNIICKPSERTALLSFKQYLNDPLGKNSLSSWSGENCCRWAGVVCSNTTDHVVELHLQQLGLGGELNPSLQELKQLSHLDLSMNRIEGISIPDFLGSLQSLRYLNLSRAGFSGMIPHQLGNLSNLRYLDLSSNYRFSSSENEFIRLTVVGNFQWISHLSSLEHLDLSDVNLENASSNWFHDVVNMLPSLLVLRLGGCSLSSGALPPYLSHVNFTSLQVLDLSYNINLNSTLPEWLYSLTNLQQLYLSWNSFQGTISHSIGNLTKLTLLDLSVNQIEGEIRTALGNLCNLQSLNLQVNQLSGRLPDELGNLTKLTLLDLSYNQLSGPLPDEQLGRLQNLEFLSLDGNSFYGSIPFSIGKLTLLKYLDLSLNELNGSIPFSMGRLTLLKYLDLSRNELNGSIPESFGNLSKLETLFLSDNSLEGNVSQGLLSNLTSLQGIELDSVVLKVSPEWIPSFQLKSARLRNCSLGPRFPNWIRTQKLLKRLDLSSNGISGIVPTWLWNLSSQFSTLNLSHNHFNWELPKVLLKGSLRSIDLNSSQFKGPLPRLASGVRELDLSKNSFSGPISTFLCNPPISENNNFLYTLDLSDNLLSGNLSECWVYWTSLQILNLGRNKITGKIPSSMGSLLELQTLHLGNNRLSGELPSSMRNITFLSSIDLGGNGLTGRLPIWLGKSFPLLLFLRLRSNKFYDEIPQEFCHLASIRVLDIAHNDLRGSIPRCFNNFSAIAIKQILFSGNSQLKKNINININWNLESDTCPENRKGSELSNSLDIKSSLVQFPIQIALNCRICMHRFLLYDLCKDKMSNTHTLEHMITCTRHLLFSYPKLNKFLPSLHVHENKYTLDNFDGSILWQVDVSCKNCNNIHCIFLAIMDATSAYVVIRVVGKPSG